VSHHLIPCDKARKCEGGLSIRGFAITGGAAAAALWLVCGTAAAQIQRSRPDVPDLLQMVGHIGPRSAGEKGGWELVLGDRYKRRTFQFHLIEMRVLNSGRLPMDILQAVEPYRPNFFLFPDAPEQMATIEAAAPTDRLTIAGYRHRGSRNILLNKVERAPAAPPAGDPAKSP
jgi:hypothetical protein